MNSRRATTLLALSAAAAGCGIGPGDPSATATATATAAATPSCGPTDGPAVTIYLADAPWTGERPAAPYVRVAIWQPRDRLVPRTWVLTGGAEGGAWWHPTATTFEIATRGTVSVSRVAPDGTVDGTVDLTFPGGGRVRRAFSAAWRPGDGRLLCG
jgi:hypothetical protein